MISTNIGMLKLLFVDDREEDLRPIRKLIEGKENMSFHHVDSVVEAKNEIKSTRPDIVIIDLKLSSQASDSNLEGKKVEDLIWDNHFCPVIIYSGFAEDYESSDTNQRRNHPLVKIVPKGRDSEDEVLNAIESFSQYSLAIQEVATDVWSARQEALRDAVPHILGESLHEESVENVKITVKRRIASMMDKPISGDTPLAAQTQYLIPPIGNNVILGDILKKREADSADPISFQVVLSPSCDMVDSGKRKAKISNVLVAKCDSLKTLLESAGMGGKMNPKLEKQIKSHVLTPGFFKTVVPFPCFSGHIPSMGANMRDLDLIPLEEIGTLDSDKKYLRVASIDSPFRELISWSYLQVAARPGLPDRNFESWIQEISDAWNNDHDRNTK